MQVKLRKIDIDKDIYSLFKMMLSEEQYLFSTKIVIQTEKDFTNWLSERLHSDFHDFYVVTIGGENEQIIGFVYNYDFSLISAHCKLCVYVLEKYRMLGIGGIATILFIKLLFQKYPIRKVYSTIYGYNHQSLESNLRFGFMKEGVVKEYRYHSGQYYDLYYLSMSRKQFELKYSQYIREGKT